MGTNLKERMFKEGNKQIKCKKCGTEYEDKVSCCPNCKAKNPHRIARIVIIIVAVLLVGGIGGVMASVTKSNAIKNANTYISVGQYQDAKTLLDKQLSANPSFDDIYITYADYYIAQKQYEEALEILETGKKKCSDDKNLDTKITEINNAYGEAIAKQKADNEEAAAEKKAAEEAAAAEAKAAEEAAAAEKAAADAKAKESEMADYIAACQIIAYSDLARNPDNYKGQKFKFAGEVVQVQEPTFGNTVTLRVNVTKSDSEYINYYTDTIYCEVDLPSGADRILENDLMTLYGDCVGLYSYTSLLGAKISVPKITIKYYSIDGKVK